MAQGPRRTKPYSSLAQPPPTLRPCPHPTGLGTQTPQRLSVWPQGVSPGGSEPPLVTITVQCAFTLALRAPRGAAPPTLRALLSQALPLQAERGQLRWVGSQWGAGGWAQLAQGSDWKGPGALGCLAFEVGSGPAAPVAPSDESLCSYHDPGSGCWVPLPEEGALQTAWWESASGPAGLRLQCRVSLRQRGHGAGGWPCAGPQDPAGVQPAHSVPSAAGCGWPARPLPGGGPARLLCPGA